MSRYTKCGGDHRGQVLIDKNAQALFRGSRGLRYKTERVGDGRLGNPYDNAKAESFMKTLKHEEVDGRLYRDVKQAKRQIGSFIEDIYNRQRLHSALDYRSPMEFEAEIRRRAPAVAFAEAMGFQGMGKSTASTQDA